MRGLACLLMFQDHCYDSWLGGGARDTNFIRRSELGGTLPAPLFLFLAGISFALVTDRMRRKGASANEIAGTTIRRGAEILGFGLLFRLQEFLLGQPWAPWTDLLRVDVLNTIGISMMLMGVVCRLAKTRQANAILAAAVGLGDCACYAAALDYLAAALAALVFGIVCERRTQSGCTAGVAVSDISLDGVCVCGAGGGVSAV